MLDSIQRAVYGSRAQRRQKEDIGDESVDTQLEQTVLAEL